MTTPKKPRKPRVKKQSDVLETPTQEQVQEPEIKINEYPPELNLLPESSEPKKKGWFSWFKWW